jgi:beta-lactamase class A
VKYVFYLLLICAIDLHAQTKSLTSAYHRKKSFDIALNNIIREVGLDSTYEVGEDGEEQISFAVIDLTPKRPMLGGVNMDNFIYPASVYKMYVAMEILKQVSENKYSLFSQYIIKEPNDVDRRSEVGFDPRPVLRAGDTVTVNYLLDLMITRSDNTAANCLIDIAGRKQINQTMHQYNWYGSEVTRKFLRRKFEDPGYDTIRGTETNALHAADFMFKIYTNKLVNPWVSMQMKALLGRQLDTTKLCTGLPSSAMFYHKSGWWSYYTNDVGIIDDGKVKYIIAVFTPVPEMKVRPRLKQLASRVHQLVTSMHD